MKAISFMKQKEHNMSQKSGFLWMSLGYIIVGIVLLICTYLPDSIELSQICFAVGILLMVVGGLSLLLYFVRKGYQRCEQTGFAVGLLMLCVGVYAAVKSLEFARIFSILISLCILMDSTLKMQLGLELLHMKQKNYWIAVAIGGVTLLLSMVLLLDPFRLSGEPRDLLAYSALIADGVANLIVIFMMRSAYHKKMTSQSEPS